MARQPESRNVVAAVRDYAENVDARLDEGASLWLTGDVGTGKTTLAMAVSAAAAHAGRSVAIYSLPRLLARIRRTYDADSGEDSYLAFFERLTSVDLLHIDDLGAEKRSDWVLEQLYAIVDERYGSERSMVVTTNLPETELEEQIGQRTVSRLVEMCGDARPARQSRAATTVTERCAPAILRRRARSGDSRCPVGRRGQGEGRRPARGAGRGRDPLSGRQQRRPHDRPRRRGVQVPPDPVGDPLPGQDVRDRERRGGRPERPDRGARRAAAQADRRLAGCASRQTRT